MRTTVTLGRLCCHVVLVLPWCYGRNRRLDAPSPNPPPEGCLCADREEPAAMNSTTDRLMTVGEVADRLAVKRSWVYDNWRAVGLPGIKVGQALRFANVDVDAWLRDQRIT